MTETRKNPYQQPTEREGWDQRYSADQDYMFGEAPNAFLERTLGGVNGTGQRALAIADGEGRNGVWLAEQGFSVDSIDFSAAAVEKARKLARRRGVTVNSSVTDLFEWDWPENAYDLVAGIFFQFVGPEGRGDLFGRMARALKPGGLLVIEGYGPKQLEYGTGGPKALENLYTEELLRGAFATFDDVQTAAYDAELSEGARHSGLSALVDFTGRKPQS